MAKSNKRPSHRPRSRLVLPHLAAAVLCENVLLEEGNVYTLIRIIDTITIESDAPTLPPGVISFHLFLLFKSGESRGKHMIQVTMNRPDGSTVQHPDQTIEFKGGEQGGAIDARVILGVKSPGVHWFDIRVSGELVTRVPLKIVYQRKTAPSSSPKKKSS